MAVINTNITSMIGQQNLNKSQNDLSTAMERLSSGLRINSAKDDAAGQAIANRMTSQVTGLTQASRNANDGISLAQTTEGALDQINDNLQRVRELTVQASNGTNSDSDLASIQDEINARLEEIDRVSSQTDFNGTKVLDGSKTNIKIQVGADDGQTISISLQKMDSDSLNLGSFDVSKMVDVDKLSAVDASAVATEATTAAPSFNDEATTTGTTAAGLYSDGTDSYVKGADGAYYSATVNDDGSVDWDSSATAAYADDTAAGTAGIDTANRVTEVDVAATTVDVSGSLDPNQTLMEIQDDAGEGTGEFVIKTTDATTGESTYAAATIDTNAETVTAGEALTSDPLKAIDAALSQVDDMRSDLGAVQNRFESAIDNLSTTSTNISAAKSRIEDADYAVEVSNMTRAQILQQAGTSVLAQANQVPQGVLSLLQ